MHNHEILPNTWEEATLEHLRDQVRSQRSYRGGSPILSEDEEGDLSRLALEIESDSPRRCWVEVYCELFLLDPHYLPQRKSPGPGRKQYISTRW